MSKREDRIALGAIHFFVRRQGQLLLTLDECGVNDYTVKHPEGALHGSAKDPWVVRVAERRVCDFFVEAKTETLHFRVRAAEGYGYLVAAFEMLVDSDDDKPPPKPDMN